ncbi:hypothetical protein J504_0145 [Acinetobacter baumannii 348935]|nr:hypothetical protein J504_0145 [Acinetobacter baumannii 348935]
MLQGVELVFLYTAYMAKPSKAWQNLKLGQWGITDHIVEL